MAAAAPTFAASARAFRPIGVCSALSVKSSLLEGEQYCITIPDECTFAKACASFLDKTTAPGPGLLKVELIKLAEVASAAAGKFSTEPGAVRRMSRPRVRELLPDEDAVCLILDELGKRGLFDLTFVSWEHLTGTCLAKEFSPPLPEIDINFFEANPVRGPRHLYASPSHPPADALHFRRSPGGRGAGGGGASSRS